MKRTSYIILGAWACLLVGGLWAAVVNVPRAPFDLRATTRFDGGTAVAVLNWRDDSDNELGFEVLRSDDAGKKFKVVGMVGANTSRYEDKVGKYVSGAFQYQVRAFNETGKSEPSNVAGVWF